MTFKQGVSGNPHGNRHRTRHLLNQEFMQALLLNFRHQGKKAIEKVARHQPAAYLKILALLVPREMKVEHSGGVKAMSDEQLEQGIEAIQRMLEARAPGERAKVIEGTAGTSLPALRCPGTAQGRSGAHAARRKSEKLDVMPDGADPASPEAPVASRRELETTHARERETAGNDRSESRVSALTLDPPELPATELRHPGAQGKPGVLVPVLPHLQAHLAPAEEPDPPHQGRRGHPRRSCRHAPRGQ